MTTSSRQSNPKPALHVVTDLAGLEAMRRDWNVLATRASYTDVVYGHAWYRAWARNFGHGGLVCVTANLESGRLGAILPLLRGDFRRGNLSFRVLRSMTNAHSPRYDFLVAAGASPELIGRGLKEAFKRTGSTLMVLENVPERSFVMRALPRMSQSARCRVLVRGRHQNCLVRPAGTLDAYLGRLSAKFVRSVRADERKAAALGEVVLHEPDSGRAFRDAYGRGLALEATGWKGRAGSAILARPSVKGFYDDLAADLYARGQMRLFLLTVGEQDAGFLLCAVEHGVVRALKIGIHDGLRAIGPGKVLIHRVLGRLFEEPATKLFDFCGGSQRWKRDWADTFESYSTVYVFPDGIDGNVAFRMARAYTRLKTAVFPTHDPE